MRESRGSDRFKSTHKYSHMYCCAEGLALQCLSYEEGEVEHINIPPLPIPMVTKTELVKGNDPRWGKYHIRTMLTRKKTKVSRATGGF